MGRSDQNHDGSPSVQIDKELCKGCVLCMQACPIKAIRTRGLDLARIEGECISCGECVRVCPTHAVKEIPPSSIDFSDKEKLSNLIVCPSTVIFSQFGGGVLPNDILLALKRMGFRYVHDQSYTNEIFDFAVELYIREKRKTGDIPFPLISPICPVVGWLIAHRFPDLLNRIPPIATPREIVTRESKTRFAAEHGIDEEEIRVLHITPCPAVMMSVKENAPPGRPYQDVAVGINHIHEMIKKNIQEIDDDRVLHHSSGVGLGMAMSGGEIAGIKSRCLAVSGLHDTIRYLEKIEMGLLNEIEYVEFRVCPEGCIGGPFAVSDRYQARLLLQKMFRMFGDEKRIKYAYVKRLYQDGWFFTERQGLLKTKLTETNKNQILKGIEKFNKVEEILKLLPRKECGVCGSPDCRTFVEDVVDGRADLEDCIFWREQQQTTKDEEAR